MNSVIARQEALGSLFKNNIVEVHTDKNFNMGDKSVNLYILYKGVLNKAFFLANVAQCFPEVQVYLTTQPSSPMFYNKKMIWRKGVWYT